MENEHQTIEFSQLILNKHNQHWPVILEQNVNVLKINHKLPHLNVRIVERNEVLSQANVKGNYKQKQQSEFSNAQ